MTLRGPEADKEKLHGMCAIVTEIYGGNGHRHSTDTEKEDANGLAASSCHHRRYRVLSHYIARTVGQVWTCCDIPVSGRENSLGFQTGQATEQVNRKRRGKDEPTH